MLNCTFTKCAIIFGSAVGTCHLDFFSDLQQLSPPKQPTIVAHSNSIISTNILMLSMGEGSEEKSCLHVRPHEKPLFFLSHCLFVALFCHMSPVFFRGEDKWFGHSLCALLFLVVAVFDSISGSFPSSCRLGSGFAVCAQLPICGWNRNRKLYRVQRPTEIFSPYQFDQLTSSCLRAAILPPWRSQTQCLQMLLNQRHSQL